MLVFECGYYLFVEDFICVFDIAPWMVAPDRVK